MISLTKAQVPDYLVGSEFYNSLSADDEEEFGIPRKFLKPNVSVSTASELKHLLNTLRFWGVLKLPYEIIELLVFKSKPIPSEECQPVCDVLLEFDREFKLFSLFKTLHVCTNKQQRLNNAQYIYLLEGKVTPEMIKGAAENGHLQLLERLTRNYLLTRERPFTMASIVLLVNRGHSCCLRFILENGYVINIGDVACCAAGRGQLACLQVAREYACTRALNFDCDIAIAALESNQVDCLEYILDKGVVPMKSMCYTACEQNRLDCLKLLHAHGAPLDEICARITSERGYLECLQYLLNQGCSADEVSANYAARNGHVDCLRLLLKMGCKIFNNSEILTAAYGHISCLRVLKEYGVELNEAYFYRNAGYGNATYLTSLMTAGYTIPQCAINAAVYHNNLAWVEFICVTCCCELNVGLTHSAQLSLPVLKTLHRYDCPWDEKTCLASVGLPNALERIRYAHENGCPWDERTAIAAARAGVFPIVKYCVLQGCPVSILTMLAAAKSCLLLAIKLLHEHNCPWNEWVCYEAVVRYDFRFLRYCLKNGCPCTVDTCLAAVRGGYLTVLQLLHEHGCPWDVIVCSAAAAWRRPLCLQYCLENDCPRDASTSLAAAQSGYLHGLKLLHEHGCPWDERVSQAAAASDNAFCLRYCVENVCTISKATMALYNRIVKYESL